MFDFANIMNAYEDSNPTPPVVIPSTPSTPSAPKLPLPNIPGVYNWPALVFALTVDTTGPNAVNLATMSNTAGTFMYNLGYLVADATNSPSWGGLHSLSDSWYLSQIQQIRNFGGDVMISFGGPKGQELAQVITSASKLKTQYQNVIDSYSISWLDFTFKVHRSLTAHPSMCAMPLSVVSRLSFQISVLHTHCQLHQLGCLVMQCMCSHRPIMQVFVSMCKAAYTQVKATGLAYFSMGITPVIGNGEYAGATFSANDASQVLLFARSNSWVAYVSSSTANTDVAYQTTNVLRGFGL
ncbi:hypothetical protein BASA83_001077 [Batrachochytrium salamandrivorans]|nr:hypothetical protein BASA83_001077 [Batrachochytrium salamandrivorans]